MQLLSAAAHSQPEIIAEHLPAVLPLLYDQTSPEAAINTFELGHFKHQVDVELRQVAARLPSACACARLCVGESTPGSFFTFT